MSRVKAKIYTSALCSYCEWSKAMLKEKGVPFEEIRIDMNERERNAMVEKTGRTSVPQIFIGDTHIGGYDDMVELDDKGELDDLLAKA